MAGGQEHRTELVAHAVFSDHIFRRFRRALQVVNRSCGNILQGQRFRYTAAKHHCDLVHQAGFEYMLLVFLRQRHGIACRHTARNNGNLVHRIALGKQMRKDGMAHLVVSGTTPVVLGHDPALLFRARNDPRDRFLDLAHTDLLFPAACREDRRLVQYVFKIRANETRSPPRDHLEIHLGLERLALRMYLEDLFPALDVRVIYRDLPVEAACPQQRRVKDVAAVRRRHNDNPFVNLKTVHFDEQLVQRLFAFVVTAAEARASLASYRVDLIDEYDAGRIFLCIFK